MGSDGPMMANNSRVAVAAALSFLMAMMAARLCTAATQFKVGGATGWALTGGNYQIWADGNTYHVGDVLEFTYDGTHSVVETDVAGFQACAPSNAILQDSSGNTAVPLQTAGTHYFMCGTAGHCPAGMKFSVTVLPASSSSSTSSNNSSSGGTTTPTASNATPSSTATNTPLITIDSATAIAFHHIAIMIPVASILLFL